MEQTTIKHQKNTNDGTNDKKTPTRNKLNHHTKIRTVKGTTKKPQILKLLFSGKGIDFVRTNGFLPKGKYPSQLLH